LDQVYNAILTDATQLSDDRRVLLYNEKLEALDPNDLGQRIKTLNLLLLETDPASRARALKEADLFARMVEAKAAEPAPEAMGPARWRLNLARLRSLAALFQGAAAQALGQYPAAERELVRSLQQSQSEEAAEHLAQVYVAEAKIPQAVDTFALALALPGSTISGRARLRAQAGELYRQLHHGSEQGFGDLILRQFDQVAARDAAEQEALAPRSPANANALHPADFVLTSLDGATHTLAQQAGKVVVVDFWATWCGPCLVQHPLLAALHREFQNNHNVTFLAVNEDEDPAKVPPFLAAHHWSRAIWLDAGLGAFLGVDSLPTVLIFDPKGHVVFRQEGFTPETFETELRQAIQRTLAAATPTAALPATQHPYPPSRERSAHLSTSA
ncbi:MAG: TlpA family protein disulfide reductase, partial [Streptosporangiaceae bacterium]